MSTINLKLKKNITGRCFLLSHSYSCVRPNRSYSEEILHVCSSNTAGVRPGILYKITCYIKNYQVNHSLTKTENGYSEKKS